MRYEDYPIAVKFKGLGAATAARISHEGSTDLDAIYLYNDGCVPTDGAANLNAYLKRLAVFAKLKIERE